VALGLQDLDDDRESRRADDDVVELGSRKRPSRGTSSLIRSSPYDAPRAAHERSRLVVLRAAFGRTLIVA
jgi:hypothetical protein